MIQVHSSSMFWIFQIVSSPRFLKNTFFTSASNIVVSVIRKPFTETMTSLAARRQNEAKRPSFSLTPILYTYSTYSFSRFPATSFPASSIHEKGTFHGASTFLNGTKQVYGFTCHIIHYLVSVPYLLSLYVCLVFFSFLPHHDHSSCCFFWYSHFPQLQFFFKVLYSQLYKH